MILSKEDKKAFVEAVIDDVPTIDYSEISTKKIRNWAMSMLPPRIYELVIDSATVGYFKTIQLRVPGCLADVNTVVPPDFTWTSIKERAPELWAELEGLARQDNEQTARIQALRETLTATISKCRTLKQALALLPEFEKYLPADRNNTGCTNLPVANLVAQLNAAGWPKGKAA